MELTPQEARRLAGALLAGGDEEDDRRGVPGAGGYPVAFGRYRVVRLIGAGGMGEVYEAEQESPHRRVAIKTVRPDLLSPELARRFDLEARVLGRLQHPGIAQIYEAGQAEEGAGGRRTPFFAMEFVEGEPLTEFARAAGLPVRARLELFLRVCEAVEHAHQRGVIHRDLKPANILIDGSGRARVLDFGVARATDADVRATTLHTEVGRLVGTLPYMSPEQVAGDAGDLDTRSDVYSLGVVLYELLAGRLPYEVGRGPVAAAARTIAETEPARLSSVDRAFRGDLDTIVGKALAKEKERRYQSVAELAGDVRRFLADEPIEARPASAMYQVRKFARRNRGVVAGLAIAFATLLGAVGVLAWESTRLLRALDDARKARESEGAQLAVATREKEEAQRQAGLAQAEREFMVQVFAAADPAHRGRDAKVVDALDRASGLLPKRFADAPEVEGELRASLGAIYRGVGQLEKAERERRRSLELLERALGPNAKAVATARGDLGLVLRDRGNFDEAEPLYRSAIATHRANGDEGALLTVENNLAGLLIDRGRAEEAVAEYERVAAGFERLDGPDSQRAFTVRMNAAVALMESQRFAAAEPILRKVLAYDERTRGPTAPATLGCMANLAACLKEQGNYSEAEPLARRQLEAAREAFGETHQETVISLGTLASILEDQKKLEEAEELHREAMESADAVFPEGHWLRGMMRSNLGRCLRLMKRYDEAEPLLKRGLELTRAGLGPEHPRARIAEQSLRALYTQWGKPERAEEYRAFVPPGASVEPPKPH